MRDAFRLAGIFLVTRLILGSLMWWFQSVEPEAAFFVLADVPTVVVVMSLGYFFGWPDGITDGHDIVFHGLSLPTWVVLGFVVGWLANRSNRRSSTSSPDVPDAPRT